MTTFNDFPDQVYNATLTGSNGVTVTGSLSPNKIIVKLDSNFLNINSTNTIVGINSGKNITSGDSNVFLGNNAGQSMTSGTYNTFIGLGAGSQRAGTDFNTALGYGADASAIAGNYNVCIGAIARLGTDSGNYNTLVGYYTDTSNYNNCSVLGNQAWTTGNNQVQLGNSSTTTYVYGTVQTRSDMRDKADIENTDLGIDFISKLRPVSFRWDLREDYKISEVEQVDNKLNVKTIDLPKDGSKKRSRKHYGFIAQEIKQTIDDMGIDFGGYQDHSVKGGKDVLSLGYEELIAPMVKSIQQLKSENDDLKIKLAEVLSRLAVLENK